MTPSAPFPFEGVLKKNDALQTPEYVWRALGKIDLDPCAGAETSIGRVNYALERGQDGLSLPWFGFVYCNPPFSQKELWIQRMAEHGNGILILPERDSAPWFGPLASLLGAYFVMGQKINFVGGPSSNNLGSVLFPFGAEARERLLNISLPGHFVEVRKFTGRNTSPGRVEASPESLNSSRPSYEQVRMGDDLETCTNPACGFRGIQPHEVKCPFCGRRTSEPTE